MSGSVGLEFREKISFVAIILPLLGVIGAIMRITGRSQEAMLAVILPALFVSFLGWRYAAFLMEGRREALLTERAMWASRDARLQREMRELIAEQQEELKQIRMRQQAEQERLMSEKASREQLSRMMDRHREEYEALLRRQSA